MRIKIREKSTGRESALTLSAEGLLNLGNYLGGGQWELVSVGPDEAPPPATTTAAPAATGIKIRNKATGRVVEVTEKALGNLSAILAGGQWEIISGQAEWDYRQAQQKELLGGVLEEEPAMLYGAMRPQTLGAGRGYGYLDYWRRQQGDVWQEYLGSQGKTALGGAFPKQTYQSFLKGYPFLNRYLGLPPEERGERASLFGPRMRWNL